MKRKKKRGDVLGTHTLSYDFFAFFPSGGIFMHAFYSPVPAKTVHTVPKISFQSSRKLRSRM